MADEDVVEEVSQETTTEEPIESTTEEVVAEEVETEEPAGAEAEVPSWVNEFVNPPGDEAVAVEKPVKGSPPAAPKEHDWSESVVEENDRAGIQAMIREEMESLRGETDRNRNLLLSMQGEKIEKSIYKAQAVVKGLYREEFSQDDDFLSNDIVKEEVDGFLQRYTANAKSTANQFGATDAFEQMEDEYFGEMVLAMAKINAKKRTGKKSHSSKPIAIKGAEVATGKSPGKGKAKSTIDKESRKAMEDMGLDPSLLDDTEKYYDEGDYD